LPIYVARSPLGSSRSRKSFFPLQAQQSFAAFAA
jgi:hypothetical protein